MTTAYDISRCTMNYSSQSLLNIEKKSSVIRRQIWLPKRSTESHISGCPDWTAGAIATNMRRIVPDRPPPLRKLSAKSVQQFRRRCTPDRQTEWQTDRQTHIHNIKLNIPLQSGEEGVKLFTHSTETSTGWRFGLMVTVRWPRST